MRYLDYSKMPDFLARHFGDPGQRRARAVGTAGSHDSGYFDIIRFYGERAADPSTIPITYRHDEFALKDPAIADFAHRMAAGLRQEGRLYDGPRVMRVVSSVLSGIEPGLTVQPCEYDSFAGSCFALDVTDDAFGKYGTLREYYKSVYPATDDEHHPLAACVGICGLVVVEDAYLLTVTRAAHLASLEASEGPSAAGSVDWSTACSNLGELIREAMAQEAREELYLDSSEYGLTSLAWAREIFRGEKPQLFCLLRTTLSRSEISDRLHGRRERSEIDEFSFRKLDLGGQLPPADIVALNHEAAMNYFLFEEWAAQQAGR